MAEIKLTTWADGYGTWHARTEHTADRELSATCEREALAAIREEIGARQGDGYDPHTVGVRLRTEYTHNDVTVREYVEIDPRVCDDCSEDYGPCENHSEVLAQREGASTRTADNLAYVFLTDVFAIMEDAQEPFTVPAILTDAVNFWSDDTLWTDNMGCRWVRDDVNAEIHDDVQIGESVLADLGLSVYWDDGYVISRVTGGPLVGEE